MSVPSLFLAIYLVLGMGTSLAMWTGKQDEIEMAMTLDLDDDDATVERDVESEKETVS